LSLGYTIRPKADLDIDEIASYLIKKSSLNTAMQFISAVQQTSPVNQAWAGGASLLIRD
jgi:hypothetical protein